MQNVLMNLVPSVKFVFILSNTRTIGSLFKFKDTLPKESRSCVIYKYVCSQCEALYVGSTIRTLHTRMSEHLGMSPRTGQPLSQVTHNLRSLQYVTIAISHASVPLVFLIFL